MTRFVESAQLVIALVASAVGTHEAGAQTERWAYLREMFPQAIGWPEGCALGDVDGDGDLDLYVAAASQPPSLASAQDRLYLNDGRGRFTEATSRLPVDSDESFAVALGDVDGDGDLDAVLANVGAPSRILRNDGRGYFQDAPALYPTQPTAGPGLFSVSLADFDRDGDLDVFFAGETKLLWLNFGGLFVDFSIGNLPVGFSSVFTRDIAVGDLDGDGDLDLVLGNCVYGAGPTSEIYLNAGNASFSDATATHFPSLSMPTWALDLGDVDGDGDLDLYAANVHQGQPSAAQDRLFLNDGTGRFAEAPGALPSETDNTHDAWIVDLDRDGDLDVVAGNGNRGGMPSQPDVVLLNDGTGIFSRSATGFVSSVIELSPHRLAIGDLDADGDLDCIAVQTPEMRVFLNRGNAELVDVTNRYPWMISNAVISADFDRDGIVDLAALSDGIGVPSGGRWIPKCMLLRGRGNGEFADVSSRLANDLPEAQHLAAGDLDRDGDIDLVFALANFASGRGSLVCAWNDGSGGFPVSTTLALDQVIFRVALGDLDGDSLLDLVVVTGPISQFTRVFSNQGGRTFTEIVGAVPSSPGSTSEAALGDLDGDGDLDLFETKIGVAGGILGFQNQIYRNGGSGVFSRTTGALPPHAEPSSSVSLGDVDGDGDLDAFVGNGFLGPNSTAVVASNRLYLNNGSGVFNDGAYLLPSLPADLTRDVALADLDGDGDLDAYVGNRGERHRLYRNNGAGRLVDASFELPEMQSVGRRVAIADVDRDGDLDICSANLGGLVLFNLQRQLAWRTPQSLGKRFAMDLHGDPNAPWILLASPGTNAIPIPPLGTLYLDPASLAIAMTGFLDAQGRGSADFLVPRWRVLLGQTVYWQAVLNPVPVLSNVEITLVTDY